MGRYEDAYERDEYAANAAKIRVLPLSEKLQTRIVAESAAILAENL